MINVNSKTELDKLVKENAVVLVDFWAEWCGPCKSLAPILEKVSARTAGKAVVAKINVDQNPELSKEYAVRGIPTMLVFKNATASTRLVGVRSENDIVTELEKWY